MVASFINFNYFHRLDQFVSTKHPIRASVYSVKNLKLKVSYLSVRYFILIFWPICRLEYSRMLKNKKKVLMAGGLIFGYKSTSVEVIGVRGIRDMYTLIYTSIKDMDIHEY